MSTRKRKALPPGIEVRHLRSCASHRGGRCNCDPRCRGRVWDPTRGEKGDWWKGPWLASVAAAVHWRQDAQVGMRKGTMRPPTATTVRDAADALVAGMRSGEILNRHRRPYKPKPGRDYETSLRLHVLPRIGDRRLSDLRRRDVQNLVDELRASGLSPSAVRNALDPLRVIVRRALRDDEILVDPIRGVELPADTARRRRIERPERARELVAALPEGERALWATLFYGGLRIGEARALRWDDLDLIANVIRVERGWDDVEGPIDAKTDAGTRRIPLAGILRRELVAHKLRTGRDGGDLVFGRAADQPFVRSTVRSRALRAWKSAELEPLKPHEARHCAASYFIACGWNAKQLTEWIGHSSVATTYDIYGKLIPGDETEAAQRLDAYLRRAK